MRNFLVIIIALLTNVGTYAQQSWALKPYAITLPKVTTAQQSSTATVPQQVGNMVYNTEQQAVAVHNGSNWAYLDVGDTGEFKNFKAFPYIGYPLAETYVWSIPAGVKEFMVEVWGGGSAGGRYNALVGVGALQIACVGTIGNGDGYSGGYARLLENVVPGVNSMTITVGKGGVTSTTAVIGSLSWVKYNDKFIVGYGSDYYGSQYGGSYKAGALFGENVTDARTMFVRSRSMGNSTIVNYVQKDASNYLIGVKLANGGLSYGALPEQGNQGGTVVALNGGSAVATTNPTSSFAYPGVGGGCGFWGGSNGSDGLVIIRW
ncbi:glycine-rich domain-containing protein [Spirosoma daeguense]